LRGRVHNSSLLLGLSGVAHALHYSKSLAHPTKSSLNVVGRSWQELKAQLLGFQIKVGDICNLNACLSVIKGRDVKYNPSCFLSYSFFFENEKIELLIKNQHIPGRKKNIPHCTLWELCTLNSIAEFGNPGEGFMVWLDIVSTSELGSGKATNCSDRSKPEVKEGGLQSLRKNTQTVAPSIYIKLNEFPYEYYIIYIYI